jgi:cytidylate kinase
MKITIDGPAGSGKSTVARRISRLLNIPYLETGKIYRSVAYYLLKTGARPDNITPPMAIEALQKIRLIPRIGNTEVEIEGKVISEELKSEEVGEVASVIGTFPRFREAVNEFFRKLIGNGSVVAEGRDAGTHIFPDAEVKVFLIADIEERAKRRKKDLERLGLKVSLEEIIKTIEERDRRDETRKKYPFVPARDAVIVDTSGKKVEEVVREVLEIIKDKSDEEPP